jgi:ATP-dependent Zn protease
MLRLRIMNQKRVSRRTGTAYHEAGHAVAAYLVRKKFRYVTIRANGEYEGYMRHYQKRDAFLIDGEEHAMTRTSIEKDMMVSLAGGAAVFLLTGKHDYIGKWSDDHKVMDLAETVCRSGRECEAYINWLYIRCESMLRSQANWHAVETLAEELLVKETISYRKAVEIIKAAKRQFRQGRWKDTPIQALSVGG